MAQSESCKRFAIAVRGEGPAAATTTFVTVGMGAGSACVAHTDGKNYCFLICTDKSQCNVNRAADVEANCSSSVVFVEGKLNVKACVPPSAGV